MRKLSKKKIKWILRWKERRLSNKDIAVAQKITPRRVKHLYTQHKNHGKILLRGPTGKEIQYPWMTSNSYSWSIP